MTRPPQRRWTAALPIVAAAACAAALVALLPQPRAAAAGGRAGPDRYATVQLRHDVLGLKTDAGLVINDAVTAARASITGRFISAGEDFVVLDVQNEEVWVPRDNVLLIHFRER